MDTDDSAAGNGKPTAPASVAQQSESPAGFHDDPVRDVAAYFSQLCECAEYYAHARSDSLRLSLRDALWHLMTRIVAIGVSIGVIVTASVYLFEGLYRGLAIALDGRLWLASVVTGLLGLFIFGAAALTSVRYARGAAHRRRVAQYEARKDRQRT
jgi:hypothetical protein